jgi:predicted Zn-dependent protease
MLAGLGIASAQAVLWACGSPAKPVKRPSTTGSGEVRGWLREAVRHLRGAFPVAHALAVSRRRTTAAIDVLGGGVARGRHDGVVLAVQAPDGTRREQVTSELTADGVAAAASALAGRATPAPIEFGAPHIVAVSADPHDWTRADDTHWQQTLLARVEAMIKLDRALTSRIVYAASLIDIDDATVWSVAEGRDLEQRLVRIRRAATRVAWNGTRPVVAEAACAWAGGIDERELSAEAIMAATTDALAMMTPGAFPDGEHPVVLDPTVTATVIDAAVRALLTSAAARRPEVARRLEIGAHAASQALTLVDDPTTIGAYGGFSFDDEGVPASPITLLDHGRVFGRLSDRAGASGALAAGRGLRPGHTGPVEPAPSHLVLAPGSTSKDELLGDGFVLEGGLGAVVDPSSDRVIVRIARAREIRAKGPTGRVYADIELVGDLAAVLASISEVSQQTVTIGVRDQLGDLPRWRSIEAPWLRGKAVVRARRRTA